MEPTQIAIFKKKEIRKTLHNGEWFFVIADVVEALTDSSDVKDYMKKMKRRDAELSKGWGQIVTLLPIRTAGGMQPTKCADAERLLRIIRSAPSQSVSSSDIESFERWLVKTSGARKQLEKRLGRSVASKENFKKVVADKKLK